MNKVIILFLVSCSIFLTNGCAPFNRNTRPVKNTVYAVFGDSFVTAVMISNEKIFPELSTSFLNKLNPNIYLVNGGYQGSSTSFYEKWHLSTFLSQITKTDHGPLERAAIMIGVCDIANNVICPKDANYDKCVLGSLAYKADLQAIIDDILKFSPSCKLVLCTLPDLNNGGMGPRPPFQPAPLLNEFNKRIFELGISNKLPVADFYHAMMGHPEYFLPKDYHPNEAGHVVMASVLEAQFEPDAAAREWARNSVVVTPVNTPDHAAIQVGITNSATVTPTNTADVRR